MAAALDAMAAALDGCDEDVVEARLFTDFVRTVGHPSTRSEYSVEDGAGWRGIWTAMAIGRQRDCAYTSTERVLSDYPGTSRP